MFGYEATNDIRSVAFIGQNFELTYVHPVLVLVRASFCMKLFVNCCPTVEPLYWKALMQRTSFTANELLSKALEFMSTYVEKDNLSPLATAVTFSSSDVQEHMTAATHAAESKSFFISNCFLS